MAKVELKQPIVDEISAVIKDAQSVVVVDYRGLTVAEDTQLRKQLREAGVSYKVYKNTLVSRAVEGTEFESLKDSLEGPNAFAVSTEDATAPARVLAEFAKKAPKLEIKAGVVSRDEKEKGERAKLNLGHTFGHAIEKLTGYGTWLHGEAVAVGTVLAAVTAEKQGKINRDDVKRIRDLIHRAGLPVRISGISAAKAIEAMKGDKKSTKGVPHFILPVAIGTTVIEEVPESLIREVLLEEGYQP